MITEKNIRPVTDEMVRRFVQGCQKHLGEYVHTDLFSQLPNVFWRGTTKALGQKSSDSQCKFNQLLFQRYRIIPKYCFNCYKILIQPRTVVELIKLMLIFEKLALPRDNPRKCMVEARPEIKGTYLGLIYSRNLQETNNILRVVRSVVAKGIAANVPISIKRGCSEFSLVYPEFPKIGKNSKPVMRYKDEWQLYENLAGTNTPATLSHSPPINYNHPTFTLNDAINVLTWLKYAKTIGDDSYMKVTELSIPLFKDLKRPPFEPVETAGNHC